MTHNCTTTMRLNCGAGRNQNQVRNSLFQKVTANIEKSIAGSVKLLDNPDLESDVKTNIGHEEVLVWNSAVKRFTNATIPSVVASAGLAKRVREFFINNTGSNSQDGSSATNAIKNVEIGIEEMSKISTTYEMVQFWILGNTIFNTGNFNGIIRDGVLGNIRRGISIRGVPVTTNWSTLGPNDAPRTGGGLSHGVALLAGGAIPINTFTAITLSTDASNKLNSWTANTNLKPETVFLKGANGIYPVIVDETQTADPDGVPATTLRRLYLVTSDSNPAANLAYEQWAFTSKITCTDLLGDGLAANVVKPGWTASGNVQFTEIHVEILNDPTPVQLNGEFQILYSMFTNVTPGGTVGSLSLSPSGVGDNADATAEIAGAIPKESTSVIRVYKSVFRDLNILVNNPCHFQDCIFYSCSFKNPRNATFESCLFYISRPHLLGDSSIQHYVGNSMYLNKCMIVYGTTGSFVTCDTQSSIIIRNTLVRPMKTNGNQSVPLIKLHEESYAIIDGLYIPANSGLNSTGSGEDKAIVISCNKSQLTIKDLKIISTGSNENSIILAQDSTDIILLDVDDACINGGPLITARNCILSIHDFDVTMDASYVLVQPTQGYFEIHDSDVAVSPTFGLDGSASTTEILFNLNNTSFSNSLGTDLTTNKFNLINNKIKKALNISYSSDVTIITGDPSSVSNGAQKNLVGRCVVDIHSRLHVIGTPDSNWNPNWSENLNWIMDDGGNGWPLFTISNGSQVSVNIINLDVTENGSQLGGQRCRLAALTESSKFIVNKSNIDITGQNSMSSLTAEYDSEIRLHTSQLNIRTGTGKSLVSITHDSHLTMFNSSVATPTLFTGANTDRLVNVEFNSYADFYGMSITAGSSCPEGIKIGNGSRLSFTSTASNPVPIIFTGTSSPNDSFFDAKGNSQVNIEHVTFATSATGAQLLYAQGLCNCYLNGVNASGANVPSKALTIEDGTRLYVGTAANDMPVDYAVGTESTPRQTIAKTALDSQKIYPQQTEISGKWNDLRGCVIIKS